jgi:hypothetical protein
MIVLPMAVPFVVLALAATAMLGFRKTSRRRRCSAGCSC